MEKDTNTEANKSEQTEYTASDIRHIMVQANFHFWGEVVDWLQKNGAADTELTPKKVNAIMRDFRNLSDKGIPFTTDPEEAESLVKENQ